MLSAEPTGPRRHAARRPQEAEDNCARNSRILGEVLRRSHSVLRRQAEKHTRLEADVEEALQSAYLLFIERFEPRYSPLPWLQTTIKREAWRIAKRSHRRRELGITAVPRTDGSGVTDLTEAFPDPEADPFDSARRRQWIREYRTAFDALKPDERTALLLLGVGYSYAEIAERRGWTYTKVNRCLSEGRARLRQLRDCEP